MLLYFWSKGHLQFKQLSISLCIYTYIIYTNMYIIYALHINEQLNTPHSNHDMRRLSCPMPLLLRRFQTVLLKRSFIKQISDNFLEASIVLHTPELNICNIRGFQVNELSFQTQPIHMYINTYMNSL